MRKPTKHLLLKIAAASVAAAGIALLVKVVFEPASGVYSTDSFGRPIDFLEPGWFYMAALVPYFFVVTTYSLTDVSRIQQYLSTGVRSVIFIGLGIALARPVWTSTDDKVATVALVDVSESVSDKQLAAAKKYTEQLVKQKRDDDKVYVITFAERPRLLDGTDPDKIVRHEDAGAGTNIQAAVQLAYGVYPDGYLPRMVVLSDGNQTGGDLLTESYRAKEMGVRVSWKTFPEDRTKEIRIASLRLPDEIKVGAPFEVKAEVWSTHEEEVKLTLRQDDFPNPLQPSATVKLEEGINWVKFKTEAKRAGFTTYTARLARFKEDTEKANNRSVMTAPVKGRPRVLYVEGGVLNNPGSAGYIKRALEHENIDVEVRGPRGLPSSSKALEKFDLVMVSDVPRHLMGMSQMRALDSYVRNLGGGLVMAGGEDSFGSGGYQNTTVEKIMPVRFDSEKQLEQPKIAIVLAVDRSGSMSGAKLQAAKDAARATAEVLTPSDMIAVVAFDSQPTTIVRMQRASNRLRISTDIARLTSGGGTNILRPLQEAHQILQGVQAKVKHVILLSDGQASYDGIAAAVQDMRADRITVSTVGIGDADQNLMRMISNNGDGRFFYTDDLASLPRIFMKETTEAQKSALVEELVSVHISKRVEMIEGTGVANAPPLRGYVSTKPKPTAEVVLVSDLGEPILARWRFGSGTSVAWTSDVKNRWSVDWIRWGGYPKFWAQVVRSSMRRKTYDSYDLTAEVDDGHARVTVDAVNAEDKFVNGLDTTLEIIDPKDSKTTRRVPMVQTAAGRYSADFAIDRYGSFMLKAVHKRDGKVVAESLGAAALPYPREYLKTTPDTEPLEHAAMVTEGLSSPEPAKIFEPGDDSISYTKDLWPRVLLFVAMGLILDVYLKRVRLFGYRTIKF